MRRSFVASTGFSVVVTIALIAFGQPRPATQGPTPDKNVTFTKDIAPILQRSCQNCHRPDSIAPMSLITYEEVRPWARAIKYRTGLRDKPDVMPPWYIEKNIGIQQFKDDMSLSEAEIATIAAWVDNGAPQGNPADMPPPRKFPPKGEWKLTEKMGKPDLVVKFRTVELPAQSGDQWVFYGDLPTGLTEDRYVSAWEAKEITDGVESAPGAKKTQTVGGLYIFHHAAWTTADADEENPEFVTTWPAHEVGRNPDIHDAEAGRLLKAGSRIIIYSAHLHANGTPTKAHLEYGFWLHPKGYKPKRILKNGVGTAFTGDIDIKGMEANQKLEAYTTLEKHTKLTAFEPHMHATGVRMCLDAIWGTWRETLSCAGYNHSWVRVYNYADDAMPLLPKGTILRITAYFDSTPANKNVADPRNWSGMGHRSIDNMMSNLSQGIEMTDEEFKEEMEARRKKLNVRDGEVVPGCPLCSYSVPDETLGRGDERRR